MKLFFIAWVVIIFLACNQLQKTVQTAKDKFNAIEKIVGTADNWQLVDGGDTSYLYFSRMGDMNFNVYDYKLVNGDSANSRMNTIIAQGDSIIWAWENEKLFLEDITDSTIVWEKTASVKDKYVLKKNDSLRLTFVFPDGHEAMLNRTLPLATFLIRSHYDYLHGTKFAFSDTIFHPKKRK